MFELRRDRENRGRFVDCQTTPKDQFESIKEEMRASRKTSTSMRLLLVRRWQMGFDEILCFSARWSSTSRPFPNSGAAPVVSRSSAAATVKPRLRAIFSLMSRGHDLFWVSLTLLGHRQLVVPLSPRRRFCFNMQLESHSRWLESNFWPMANSSRVSAKL